jgi:hypothetical protein
MHSRLTPVAVAIAVATMLAQTPVSAQKGSDFDARAKAALDRSRPVLLKKLRKGHGGELALLCLAAVHDGVPRDDKSLVKAMKKLSRTSMSATYDLSLRLMVASEYAWLPKREALAVKDVRKLLKNITRDGGFDYGSKARRWDLSNTQYGAFGLRAAISMGAKVPPKIWKGLMRAAISAQNENGGFSYMAGGRGQNVSMTTAGIAVMQLCSEYLDDATVKALEVEKRLAAAWDFMAEHKGEIGARNTRNSFYFHYGLERSCILSDVKDVDGKDWYESGGEMFLATQLKGGGWRSHVDHIQGGPDVDGSDSVSTSFAILFLRRQFKKVVGPITPSRSVAITQLTPQSSKDVVEGAVKSVVARGRSALPGVLRALRSTIKIQRIAGARALIGITGKDFGFNPHVSPEKSKSAVTKAELWWLKSKGVPEKRPKTDKK